MYQRNGDPGYPGDPAEATITAIEYLFGDVTYDLLQDVSDSVMSHLTEQAFNYIAELGE